MNEPHDMPKPGGVIASNEEAVKAAEDLTIWPAYAQAAIDAIRAIDTANPIYVAGNQYSSAMVIGTKNPGFPLRGSNLIYEVHMYLDAFSNGASFDYDAEVAKNFSAGFGAGAIHPGTGLERLKGHRLGQGRRCPAGADRGRDADRRPALGADVPARCHPCL